MPLVVVWTEAEIDGLAHRLGLSRILTEVGEDGKVIRELGFDDQGRLVHRHPGEPTRAKFGVFDLAEISPADHAEVDCDEFERLWSA